MTKITGVYMNENQKKVIKKAAELEKRSLSNFMVVSALERANTKFEKKNSEVNINE